MNISTIEIDEIAMENFNIPRIEEPGPTVADLKPEPADGPVEVAPGLYAANLLGAARVPIEYAVISLCRTADLFGEYRYRRQVYLIDKGRTYNPNLAEIVLDTVNALDMALDTGLNVVVHCHGGRSRTALILKAWKMRRDGVDEPMAHAWLKDSWSIINRHNTDFHQFLVNEWSNQ
jgi:ADP-ribosyl-[dinitrogen reductase] hydrolase